MAIPNEVIIKKMINELKEAQLHQANKHQMIKHIEHVRLLSDLLIEGDQGKVEQFSNNPEAPNISDEEIKAMLGGSNNKKINDSDDPDENDDAGTGKSIFDF
ncbi:DUF5327 family protein [Virgibacillus flavescens]|uniref:DUF5327 family protein n=1 Tax=Virgibacillus flavescens TaxID=1611422 RepID=UPI003D34EF6A